MDSNAEHVKELPVSYHKNACLHFLKDIPPPSALLFRAAVRIPRQAPWALRTFNDFSVRLLETPMLFPQKL